MQSVLHLTWSSWRMRANVYKEKSILARLGFVFLLLLLLFFVSASSWEFLFMFSKDERGPIFSGTGFFFYVLAYYGMRKDMRPYLIFPVNPVQVSLSVFLSEILSYGTLFLIGSYLWVGLCVTETLTEFSVYVFLFPVALVLVYATIVPGIFMALASRSSRAWKTMAWIAGTIFYLLALSLPCIFFYDMFSTMYNSAPPLDISASLDAGTERIWKPIAALGGFGKTILPYLPTTIFFSLFNSILDKNILYALYEFLILLFYSFTCLMIGVFIIRSAMREESASAQPSEFQFRFTPFSEKLSRSLLVSPDAQGVLFRSHLPAARLRWDKKQKRATATGFLSVFLMVYLMSPRFVYLVIHEFQRRIFYLPFFMACILIPFVFVRHRSGGFNFLGAEGKALTTMLSFPVDRKQWMMQIKRLNVYGSFIASVSLSLFIVFFGMSFRAGGIAFLSLLPAFLVFSGAAYLFSVLLPMPPAKGALAFQMPEHKNAPIPTIHPAAIIPLLFFFSLPFFLTIILTQNTAPIAKIIFYGFCFLCSILFHEVCFSAACHAFPLKEQAILENWKH